MHCILYKKNAIAEKAR